MIFEEIHEVHDAIMPGLTHDTLMLIGWRHGDRPLHVRPWACDRFRVVTSGGEGWKDVSVEVAKWLTEILQSDKKHRGYYFDKREDEKLSYVQ